MMTTAIRKRIARPHVNCLQGFEKLMETSLNVTFARPFFAVWII